MAGRRTCFLSRAALPVRVYGLLCNISRGSFLPLKFSQCRPGIRPLTGLFPTSGGFAMRG